MLLGAGIAWGPQSRMNIAIVGTGYVAEMYAVHARSSSRV